MQLKKFEKGTGKYTALKTWRGDNYRGYIFQLENDKKYQILVTDSEGEKYSKVMHFGKGFCAYCGSNDRHLYCKKLAAADFLEELKNHPKIRLFLLF